jgi:UDP-glucuronate 4-epimerase
MKKILITGAAGFIGSHLAERLLGDGHSITGMDNFDDFYDPKIKRGNIAPALKNRNYRLIEADILDTRALERIFKADRYHAVVHLAARAGVRPSIEQPALYQRVNVEGTANVLEAMRRAGVRRLIFGSSSSVYGSRKRGAFKESEAADRPVSQYAASKRAGELLCHTYRHLYGFDATALRFFTVYGPRQRPEMAIHKFTRLIAAGRPVPVFGRGESKRDYTYISDIINGVANALRSLKGEPRYRIFNLGNSRSVNLLYLIDLIGHALGKKATIQRMPFQDGDVPATFADISQARKEMGFAPTTSIEEGILRFVKWFKEGVQDGSISYK